MLKKFRQLWDTNTLNWILKKTIEQKFKIIYFTILSAFNACMGVFTSVVIRLLVDSAEMKDKSEIVHYSIIIIIILALQVIIGVVTNILNFIIYTKLQIKMKNDFYKCIINKNYKDISKFHTGELINRMNSDVAIISGNIISIIPNITYCVVKLVGVFIVLYSINKIMALVSIACGFSMSFMALIFKNKMKTLHKKVQTADGKIASFYQETLASLLVIKAFHAENKVANNGIFLQDESFKIKRKRNNISVFANVCFGLVFSVIYVYSLIWGAFAICNGKITYGILTSMLSLVLQIKGPTRSLAGMLPAYYQTLASAERLMEIENFENETEFHHSELNVAELYNELKKIEVENITFSYGRENVLENTSITIEKGDFIAIAGISGIGKSTLTKLIMNVIEPIKGQIYLELKDGKKEFIDKHNRRLFAYVPQGNFLLSGTIKENIAFMCENATDEQILQVAKIACADKFISELPNGLNTVIGEKGKGLSEGQVQRIAIARAIMTNSPILILDEATSALDEKTEIQLLNNIKDLQNKTCIFITHKASAKKICNKEIIIENKKMYINNFM